MARITQDEAVDRHIGRRIRMARRQAQPPMTQQEVASAIGVAFQQVQKYEKGSNRISASKLLAVARYFSLPVAWFYEGIETPTTQLPVATATQQLMDETIARKGGLEIVREIQHVKEEALLALVAFLRSLRGAK